MFRLDKTAFKRQSISEADANREYWLKKTPEERFKAAHYLNSAAFNFSIENPPRLNKMLFKKRVRK